MVWADTKGEPKNGQAEAERARYAGQGGRRDRRVSERRDQDRQPGHRAAEDPFRMLGLLFPHADRARVQVLLPGQPPRRDLRPRPVQLPEGPREAQEAEGPDRGSVVREHRVRLQRRQGRAEVRQGVRVQGGGRHLLHGQRDRRHQRGGPADQGQPGRAHARLLHHRRHPVHQDIQGDGLQSQGHGDDGRLHRARLSAGGEGGRELHDQSARPLRWTWPRTSRWWAGQRALQEEVSGWT